MGPVPVRHQLIRMAYHTSHHRFRTFLLPACALHGTTFALAFCFLGSRKYYDDGGVMVTRS